MSDSRVLKLESLTRDAHKIIAEFDAELPRDHNARHFVKWLQIRLTQAEALTSELKDSL